MTMNSALAASIDHIRYDVSLAPIRIPSSANTAPASGCIRTNIGHSFAVCASTAGSSVKARGSACESGSSTSANTAPTTTDQPIIRTAASYAASGIARAECPSDDHLSRDRDRVEDQREEDEELVRDLVRAELRVADARQHRRGDEERRVQRNRPHEDLPADADHRPHLLEARPLRRRVRTQQLDDERDAHPELRDRGARSRSGDPPVEHVDEHDLEDEIHGVRDHDDHQRPAEIRDAAEVALARERDDRRREPDRGDAEVDERVVPRLAVAAERAQERLRGRLADDEQHRADRERRPQRLRREPGCALVLARAGRARDHRCRPVRQEVEDRERAREDDSGEAQPGQLRAAQMADDRRVGQDVERFGRERPEGGQREPQDLAIVW